MVEANYVCGICRALVRCEKEIGGVDSLRCKAHGGEQCGACPGCVTVEGVKFDAGKTRLDLFPPEALEEIGKVLTYGAKKYSQYGECTCSASNAKSVNRNSESSANRATKNGYDEQIPAMQNANERTSRNGSQPIQTEQKLSRLDETRRIEPRSTENGNVPVPMGSQSSSFDGCLPSDAPSADRPRGSTSITTTEARRQGEPFAIAATSVSGSLNGPIAGSTKHSPTCGALRVVRDGANNWAKGMDWSRYLAAALRHLNRWNAGQDRDPESGLLHLAHAGCCLVFLLASQERGIGVDDRWKPSAR